MRAVVVTSWDRPPTVEQRPDPQATPGEVLVRIRAAAIGHLDLDVAAGAFPVLPQLPFTPGVEAAGVVEAAPADCEFDAGTAVLVRGAGLGVVRDGSWAELVSVPADALERAPDGLDFPLAACFFVPTTTAAIALRQVGAVAGTRVLVTGARGAVGSVAVQLAARLGCEVVASTRSPLGYEVPSASVRVVEAGREAELDATEVDCIIDTVGGLQLGERLALVRPGGCCAVVGYAAGPESRINLPAWLVSNVHLIPVNGIAQEALARELAPGLAADLASGALQLPVQTFALTDVVGAMTAVRRGEVGGRAVIVP